MKGEAMMMQGDRLAMDESKRQDDLFNDLVKRREERRRQREKDQNMSEEMIKKMIIEQEKDEMELAKELNNQEEHLQ